MSGVISLGCCGERCLSGGWMMYIFAREIPKCLFESNGLIEQFSLSFWRDDKKMLQRTNCYLKKKELICY